MSKFNLQPITTGIYIGAKDIYIAQAKKTIFGVRLLKFAKVEIPAVSQSDETAKKQAITRAIKRGLEENKIRSRRVVTALAGKDVLLRYFQMPRIPKKEWETAIKFEAKKYIPFKIDELMWRFQAALPKKDKAAKMDVTFMAVKKNVAQRHLSLLEQAGLKVQALEPAPTSLIRLLALSNQLAKDKPTAIVDIDYTVANINIVQDRLSYLTRDASLPSESELVFDSLLNEIRMSLDYYEKLFPAQVLAKIVLCGQGELRDWAQKLAQELKLPTETADLARALKIPRVLPPLSMSIACGLALSGLTPVLKDVNLYKASEVKAPPAAKKEGLQFTPEIKRTVFAAVSLSCIGLLTLQLVMSWRISQQRQQLEREIALKPKVSLPISHLPYEQLEQREKEMEGKLSALSAVIDKRVLWTNKLNELPKIIPPGLWLTGLSFDDKLSKDNQASRSLMIKGTAYHQDPVQEVGLITGFISDLQENKLFAQDFEEIKLEAMTSRELQGKAVKDFTISCKK